MNSATLQTEMETELHEPLDIGNIEVKYGGVPIRKAEKVIIMMHGGSGADTFLKLSSALAVQNVCLIAPMSERPTWFANSVHAPVRQNEPWLSIAINIVRRIVEDLYEKGIDSKKIYFMGFSHGGSVVLEYIARNPAHYGGVIALASGLVGEQINKSLYSGNLHGTTVFLGIGANDTTMPIERLHETEEVLIPMQAITIKTIYPDVGHTIISEQLKMAGVIIRSKLVR